MKQEVTLENNLLPPKNKVVCPVCLKHKNNKCFVFNKLLNQSVCHQCNKKKGNNKFYDPNWKIKNQRVSKWSLSNQEKSLLITTKLQQGKTYEQAKNRVNYCESVLSKNKSRKYFEDKRAEENLINQKENNKEMNKKLVEGLNGI
jgi:hypothetical protein